MHLDVFVEPRQNALVITGLGSIQDTPHNLHVLRRHCGAASRERQVPADRRAANRFVVLGV